MSEGRGSARPDDRGGDRGDGFGLRLDRDGRQAGRDAAGPSTNDLTPAGLEVALRAAPDQSDEYVRIDDETTRWWSARSGPVALPPAHIEAARNALEASGADREPVGVRRPVAMMRRGNESDRDLRMT